MIPKSLVYRIYNDSLAIAMNVKTNHVVLLQNEALDFWKKIILENKPSHYSINHPVFNQLVSAGILEQPSDYQCSANIVSNYLNNGGAQEIDLGVVNYWAFKNHIPLSGHFELTAQCNERCKHCYCVFTKQDTLTTEQVCRIINDLQQSGTLGLVLTGGEIFFRKDILDILQHLYDKKFVLRLNTNATLIDELLVKKLVHFQNIYRIHISVYSSRPEVHDQIVNSSGAFKKTIKALQLLKEAGFNLRINCSVMQSNYDSYQAIVNDIGDKMEIPVHFDSAIYPRDDGNVRNLAEQIDLEQFKEFWKFNTELQRHKATNKSEPIKSQKLCKAGYAFFSICEDGSLYPCLKMKRFYKNPLGNLATQSFFDIWNRSEAINNIRISMDNKLRECSICDLNI